MGTHREDQLKTVSKLLSKGIYAQLFISVIHNFWMGLIYYIIKRATKSWRIFKPYLILNMMILF